MISIKQRRRKEPHSVNQMSSLFHSVASHFLLGVRAQINYAIDVSLIQSR